MMECLAFIVRLVPVAALCSWFYLVIPDFGPSISALALAIVKSAL